jgi:replicative DNA helicase
LKILAEELVKRKIREKYNSLAEAPAEFVEAIKKIELDFITESKPKNIGELFAEYSEKYASRKERIANGGAVGVITGFSKIDENCAFEAGGLVVLAAKTSVGKTALALNIAINAAMFGQKVLFFTAEMQVNELMHRVLAQLTGVSSLKFKYANADHSMAVATNEVEAIKDKISFIEASKITSSDICRIIEKEKDVDLVVVDYIQYLQDKVEKGQTNNDRVGQITRNLKSAAVGNSCAILALSQVNRAASGIPELHNLRDSGNIEQDSDIVLILHREDRDEVLADLVVAKNRNGAIYKTKIKFDKNLTKFYE